MLKKNPAKESPSSSIENMCFDAHETEYPDYIQVWCTPAKLFKDLKSMHKCFGK